MVDLCSQRLALSGKNILLTPDNLVLPRQGLRELKQLLTRTNGTLFEDKTLTISFKSEHKFGKGRAAMRIQSKQGTISSLKVTIATDGGLSLELASPIEKPEYCDILLSYSN